EYFCRKFIDYTKYSLREYFKPESKIGMVYWAFEKESPAGLLFIAADKLIELKWPQEDVFDTLSLARKCGKFGLEIFFDDISVPSARYVQQHPLISQLSSPIYILENSLLGKEHLHLEAVRQKFVPYWKDTVEGVMYDYDVIPLYFESGAEKYGVWLKDFQGNRSCWRIAEVRITPEKNIMLDDINLEGVRFNDGSKRELRHKGLGTDIIKRLVKITNTGGIFEVINVKHMETLAVLASCVPSWQAEGLSDLVVKGLNNIYSVYLKKAENDPRVDWRVWNRILRNAGLRKRDIAAVDSKILNDKESSNFIYEFLVQIFDNLRGNKERFNYAVRLAPYGVMMEKAGLRELRVELSSEYRNHSCLIIKGRKIVSSPVDIGVGEKKLVELFDADINSLVSFITELTTIAGKACEAVDFCDSEALARLYRKSLNFISEFIEDNENTAAGIVVNTINYSSSKFNGYNFYIQDVLRPLGLSAGILSFTFLGQDRISQIQKAFLSLLDRNNKDREANTLFPIFALLDAICEVKKVVITKFIDSLRDDIEVLILDIPGTLEAIFKERSKDSPLELSCVLNSKKPQDKASITASPIQSCQKLKQKLKRKYSSNESLDKKFIIESVTFSSSSSLQVGPCEVEIERGGITSEIVISIVEEEYMKGCMGKIIFHWGGYRKDQWFTPEKEFWPEGSYLYEDGVAVCTEMEYEKDRGYSLIFKPGILGQVNDIVFVLHCLRTDNWNNNSGKGHIISFSKLKEERDLAHKSSLDTIAQYFLSGKQNNSDLPVINNGLQGEDYCCDAVEVIASNQGLLEHDLRNSIANLHLSLANLFNYLSKKEENRLDKKIVKYQQNIEHYINGVTTRLDISPRLLRGEFKLTRVNILECVQKALSISFNIFQKREQAGEPIQIENNISDNLYAQAEPVSLVAVLHGIISNALDAMKGKEGTIVFNALVSQMRAVIEIENTGSKIPKNELSKIFKASYTTKKDGMGIALFLVIRILKRCQGIIEVKNTDKGVKFIVTLRAYNEADSLDKGQSSSLTIQAGDRNKLFHRTIISSPMVVVSDISYLYFSNLSPPSRFVHRKTNWLGEEISELTKDPIEFFNPIIIAGWRRFVEVIIKTLTPQSHYGASVHSNSCVIEVIEYEEYTIHSDIFNKALIFILLAQTGTQRIFIILAIETFPPTAAKLQLQPRGLLSVNSEKKNRVIFKVFVIKAGEALAVMLAAARLSNTIRGPTGEKTSGCCPITLINNKIYPSERRWLLTEGGLCLRPYVQNKSSLSSRKTAELIAGLNKIYPFLLTISPQSSPVSNEDVKRILNRIMFLRKMWLEQAEMPEDLYDFEGIRLSKCCFNNSRLKRFLKDLNFILEICDWCNHNCLCCLYRVSNKGESMKYSKILTALDIMKQSGINKIAFCGAYEPFNYCSKENSRKYDLSDVVEAVYSRGFEFWIVTHGWSMKDEIAQRAAEKIATLSYPVDIRLSFHLWHKDVYNMIYKNSGNKKDIEDSYYAQFSNVINTLSSKSLICSYLYDGMKYFPEMNAFQLKLGKRLKKDFSIFKDAIDLWRIEWAKGRARELVEPFIKSRRININDFSRGHFAENRSYNNFSFVIGRSKESLSLGFLTETTPLNETEIEVLLGPELLEEGFRVELKEEPKIHEIFKYRIISPDMKINEEQPSNKMKIGSASPAAAFASRFSYFIFFLSCSVSSPIDKIFRIREIQGTGLSAFSKSYKDNCFVTSLSIIGCKGCPCFLPKFKNLGKMLRFVGLGKKKDASKYQNSSPIKINTCHYDRISDREYAYAEGYWIEEKNFDGGRDKWDYQIPNLDFHLQWKDKGGNDNNGNSSSVSPFMEEAGIQKICKGVVRDGFLKPGLKVITDKSIFDAVQKIHRKHNSYKANIVGGYYLFEDSYQNAGPSERAIFRYLDETYKNSCKRVVIVPDSNIERLRHEILHDVIELESINNRSIFEELSNFMYNLSAQTRDKKIGYIYSEITEKNLTSRNYNSKEKEDVLIDFIAVFFSGILARSRYTYKDYSYLIETMPSEAKRLFYELGFIWPMQNSSPCRYSIIMVAVPGILINIQTGISMAGIHPAIGDINENGGYRKGRLYIDKPNWLYCEENYFRSCCGVRAKKKLSSSIISNKFNFSLVKTIAT
ncbi:MAG: HAMP domain-containing sensor histidine kinase, partial [Candidatus Omnitrophota bacterium]